MRKSAGRFWSGMVLVVAVAAGGCASGQPGVAGTEPATAAAAAEGMSVVTIQNDHTSRRDIMVYVEPEGRGERQNLGRVPAGQTTSFTVNLERGFYRLVAGHDMGDIRSNRFNVSAPSTVQWQLNAGRLQVSRR
jgi:hypothetical protein